GDLDARVGYRPRADQPGGHPDRRPGGARGPASGVPPSRLHRAGHLHALAGHTGSTWAAPHRPVPTGTNMGSSVIWMFVVWLVLGRTAHASERTRTMSEFDAGYEPVEETHDPGVEEHAILAEFTDGSQTLTVDADHDGYADALAIDADGDSNA